MRTLLIWVFPGLLLQCNGYFHLWTDLYAANNLLDALIISIYRRNYEFPFIDRYWLVVIYLVTE